MFKQTVLAAMFLVTLMFDLSAQNKPFVPINESNQELIQIAILLDASNSMDGLIGQAKSQLWKIVNELALAKRNGKSPLLEVAFYEYGKSSLPSSSGYIRQIVPLSKDLDKISDELFKLSTNGGDEYCGEVISKATRELEWNPSNTVMKAIFIAGNEPFSQGSLDYKKACKDAITKGIVVNTIFCGDAQEGISSGWKDGADLADGSFISINQNQTIVDIIAPQDSLISVLGQQLNSTYIAYGNAGKERQKMQERQDANAVSAAPAAMVQRSIAKSSKSYTNDDWDLVDAKKNKKLEISKMDDAQLPKEMKDMDESEREKYIETKSKQRDSLQTLISTLNEERRKYVESEQKKNSSENTLDKAIITSVRKMATGKGFNFESK